MGDGGIFLGGGGPERREPQRLLLKMANRHGLVAGATGTGKTVTLQVLAEAFSAAGVPVFCADVKGDLSGLADPGSHEHPAHGALVRRAARIGLEDFGYEAVPVVFWDLLGEEGHPIRTTVTEIGPVLLARLMELNEVQEGVLAIAFRLAEDEGLALLDLKDLRALMAEVGARARELSRLYGNVSPASVGAIQRRLLVLETQGADRFFGEPALRLSDMIATTPDGRGRVNVLAAARLMETPRLYATVLLWLLSELFEELPEVGDPDRPAFVFFFDEAHLLFNRAPRALVEQVERVARLIRSKGVGVWFVTQEPDDVPEEVLAQLGNRVQHALRAFTPRQAKALRAAAQTFRPNPAFETADAIRDCRTGEAVVSLLDAEGRPGVAQRVMIRPPSSRLGPCTPATRNRAVSGSPLAGLYDTPLDRHSAYEALQARAEARTAAEAQTPVQQPRRRSAPDDPVAAAVRSALRSAGTQIGRQVVRSLMRGLFR